MILAVLAGHEKETVKAFLEDIHESLRATVEVICIDMYQGFAGAAGEVLPSARVVADRFHVANADRAALDSLRQTEVRQLKAALRPDGRGRR